MVKGISENLERVVGLIREACLAAQRPPEQVALMAVTKSQSVETVQAAQHAGLQLFGENRVQEAVGKMPACGPGLQWELIGHLQTNKARLAVQHFARIQTVDREKLARVLARQAEALGREELSVLIQVNAGNDPAKFGCTVEEAPALVEAVLGLSPLRLDGFMTIAPLDDDVGVSRACFARLRKLRDRLSTEFDREFPVLSMGMSGDFREAIAEGSTLVRVGSALFGDR